VGILGGERFPSAPPSYAIYAVVLVLVFVCVCLSSLSYTRAPACGVRGGMGEAFSLHIYHQSARAYACACAVRVCGRDGQLPACSGHAHECRA